MNFALLMSVYNGDDANIFELSLESILKSTLQPSTVYLVIDGPIDASIKEVITKYSSLLNMYVKESEVNLGLPNALNLVIAEIAEDWTFRFDADDYNISNRFETQMQFIQDNYVDVLGGQILEIDQMCRVGIRQVPLHHENICRWLPYRNPMNHVTVAIRTELLKRYKYRDVRYFEDYDLWMRMSANPLIKFLNLDDILVEVRTGTEMVARRSGLSYAKYELNFRLTTICFAKSKFKHLLYGFIRAAIAIFPITGRKVIYQILRK